MIERLWSGATAVCIGSGPSLTPADVDYVRGKARVIVVNTTYQLAPWADVLYAADAPWWDHYAGAPDFGGLKVSIEQTIAGERGRRPQERWGVTVLKNTGVHGLEQDPSGLRTGRNSGYQAIGLAYHLGASRIVLLGYDMRGAHWHPAHPASVRKGMHHHLWRQAFATLAEPLRAAGVTVVNASRETALDAFPRMPLQDALPIGAEVAA